MEKLKQICHVAAISVENWQFAISSVIFLPNPALKSIELTNFAHYLRMRMMTSSSDFKNHITMLGTGNALATRCYNKCFTLHSSGGAVLMVDAGGGNGVLTQLERVGVRCEDIHNLFVTHAHTDHLLGNK